MGYTLGSQSSKKRYSVHVFLDITATKALLNERHAILNSRVSGIAKQKNCYFIWANSALNKFLAVVYLEGQLLLPNRHP